MANKIKRRSFIKTSIAAVGGAAAAERTGKAMTATPAGPVLRPSDALRVGVIGCGGQGRWNMTDFVKQPEIQIAAPGASR